MHDVAPEVGRLLEGGERFALATVVGTWNSAPRQPGAAMVVSTSGEPTGSVSGGCVEGAVYELAQEVMATGEPVLQRYGVSDDDAFAVGLTCGGIIDVFVEPVDHETYPALAEVLASVRDHEPVAVATVVDGPGDVGAHLAVWQDRVAGSLGSPRLDQAVADDVRGMLDHGATGVHRVGPGRRAAPGRAQRVRPVLRPAPADAGLRRHRLRGGGGAGRQVPRLPGHGLRRPGVFATPRRFPEADEVVVEWPHRYLAATAVDARTVICVLTHDPKFDVPLLEVALGTDAAYIGAMGSRRTHDDRLARLREEGVSERGRPGPPGLADRSRHRGAHPRGDRRVDRGRDRRSPLGRHRSSPHRHRRRDPPARTPRPAVIMHVWLRDAIGAGQRPAPPAVIMHVWLRA